MTIALDIACSEATRDEKKAAKLWERYFQRLNDGARQLRRINPPRLPQVVSLEGVVRIDGPKGEEGNGEHADGTLEKSQPNLEVPPGITPTVPSTHSVPSTSAVPSAPATPSTSSAPGRDAEALSFKTTHSTRKLAAAGASVLVATSARSPVPWVTTGMAKTSSPVPTLGGPLSLLPPLRPSLFSPPLFASPSSFPRNGDQALTPGEESAQTEHDNNPPSSSASGDGESEEATIPVKLQVSSRNIVVISSDEGEDGEEDETQVTRRAPPPKGKSAVRGGKFSSLKSALALALVFTFI
jgi:hypothetical protein